jgi:hypothetical protein
LADLLRIIEVTRGSSARIVSSRRDCRWPIAKVSVFELIWRFGIFECKPYHIPVHTALPSPLPIITDHAWEQAFFTTYALSLTFFESQIRGALIQRGCREMWIMTDTDGYDRCLDERLARSVGAEYRVVPVAMKKGVFHPKLTYLAGKNEHVIILGSGNLTFHGYGRNVEVAEVISSLEHPAIFADLVEWLDWLALRDDFLNPDAEWIPALRAQAVKAAAGAQITAPGAHLRLLHSLEVSFSQQIIAQAKLGGGGRELRVLSPFYDADAAAVIGLASGIGAKKVKIGLLPEKHEQTTFPFAAMKKSQLAVSAAEVHVSDEEDDESLSEPQRSLHAKWFELDLAVGSQLVLTGSVNATTKSLATTDNVELALLRHYAKKKPTGIQWQPVDAPLEVMRHDFRSAGIKERTFVYARLSGDGVISGKILGAGTYAGEWQALLAPPAGDEHGFTVAVSERATFSLRLQGVKRLLSTAALQLCLMRGEQCASGWVSAEMLLASNKTGLMPVGVLLRHLNHESTQEDDVVLLNYLNESVLRHLLSPTAPALPKEGTAADKSAAKDEQDVEIDLQRLATMDEDDPASSAARTAKTRNLLEQTISQLRQRLRERLGQRVGNVAAERDETDGEPDDDEDETATQKLTSALDAFEERIREIIDTATGDSAAQALMIWREVKLAMLLHRMQRQELAPVFLRAWLNVCTRKITASTPMELLDRYVIGSCAFLTAYEVDATALPLLHEELQAYCGGEPTLERIEVALAGGVEELLRPLLPAHAPSLTDAILTVLAAPSVRQQIEAVRAWFQQKGPQPSADLPIFQTPVGRQLALLLEQPASVRCLDRRPGSTACPKCNIGLSRAAIDDLLGQRLCLCGNCQRFIFDPHLPALNDED